MRSWSDARFHSDPRQNIVVKPRLELRWLSAVKVNLSDVQIVTGGGSKTEVLPGAAGQVDTTV